MLESKCDTEDRTMKDISYEKLDTIYFRKERMHSCIQQLLDEVNGRSIPLKELISENGKPSKKKRGQLIEELMDCLLIYLGYRTDAKNDPERQILDEKRTECLKSFLHCALDILSHDPQARLSDLIALSYSVPIRKNFIDLLIYRFERTIFVSPDTSIRNLYGNDCYTEYVRDLERSSSKRTPDFIDRFCFYHFPLDGFGDIGEILYFQYLMDADDSQIDMMLNILKRNHVTLPFGWLTGYQNDRQKFAKTRHPSYTRALRDDDILAFWNFLSLQDKLHSVEAFRNLISGMIDVYTSLYCDNMLSDTDHFYEIYDQLERTCARTNDLKKAKVD